MQKTAVAQGWRWRIPVILGITFFVNYLDRNNLALALPQIANDFGWNNRELANNGQFLLAAFFLTYGLSNMLLSPLAERLGAKRSAIGAVTMFSLCTLLSAPLGRWLVALIGLRLLLGIGEGVHVPMLGAITSRWFAPQERSRANAIWNVGILVATALGPLFLVPLISTFGWRVGFAVLGIVGLLISVPLLWLFVDDRPKVDYSGEREPAFSSDYIDGIGSSGDASAIEVKKQVSFTPSRSFWLLVAGGTFNAFCGFGVLSWLPTYFTRAKGIDFSQLGWPLALVFTSGILSVLLMAILGDRINRRAWLASVGLLMGGVMVFFAARSNSLEMLVFFFAAAVFCQSAYTGQEHALVQRLVPAERVGTGTGLYNGLSVLIGGVGGSLVPGTVVAITGDFNAGLLSIVIGAIIGGIILGFLARAIKY
jgi:sugar phosphate permease